ncbi:hypothetical protein [Microbacterium oleivorans]|uniref:Uncharacterized protein n=1 Tax=Microbacterium oleivorans TaxID=273677 RepID=A0A4R5YLB7_9MICO|nr:hypothetical protein [Microbacterium oleivorans]TDL44054.1 hypothetical protein E2R54_12875 [Microbacterium oleivorans]
MDEEATPIDAELTRLLQLAEALSSGGAGAHAVATLLKSFGPGIDLDAIIPGYTASFGRMERRDGSARYTLLPHYLREAQADPDAVERSWWAGALLTLGDALAEANYLDRAPELELIYHLRNAVAHGNKVSLTGGGRTRLQRWPANNFEAYQRSDPVELTIADEGAPVLFDMLRPADLADLFDSVAQYVACLRTDTLGYRWWMRENDWPWPGAV